MSLPGSENLTPRFQALLGEFEAIFLQSQEGKDPSVIVAEAQEFETQVSLVYAMAAGMMAGQLTSYNGRRIFIGEKIRVIEELQVKVADTIAGVCADRRLVPVE